MGYQDASGRRLSYDSYLRIPQLLELQQGLTQAHDELLFIVVHQVYELWFKVLIDELESVRTSIETEDLGAARHALSRVKVIEDLLVEQVAVLETMAPQDFLTFRSELAPASGFQSVQFREIEFLSGLKDAGYIKALDGEGDARARLQRRLDEPSWHDVFTALMNRRAVTVTSLCWMAARQRPTRCALGRAGSRNPCDGGIQIHGFIAGVGDQRLGDVAPDQPLPHTGQCRRSIEEVEGHRLAANECEDPRLSRFRLQLG